MKKFMDDSFLLQTKTAEQLYSAVKDLPIIDWHCHLDPREIAEDKQFESLTELWLAADHYKWRVMRAYGVEEEYITGGADDFEKFGKWAGVIENCIGNPLYHWTHLELRRVFGCDIPLSSKTAAKVWKHCSKVLEKGLKVSDVFKMFNVEMLCTSDNPADSLEFHELVKNSGLKTAVKPTFRPTDLLSIENPGWTGYINTLSELTGVEISDYESLKEAVFCRADFFAAHGCTIADHALDPPVYHSEDDKILDIIIRKALDEEALTYEEICGFKTEMQVDLVKKYNELGWTMQLHMGTARGVNTTMTALLGTDCGYDCIAGSDYSTALLRFLDRLEVTASLPRTILFNLNPKDNDLIAAIAGSFSGHEEKGKVQPGAAWWFNDHKDGMEAQLRALANNGILGTFAGMLTDSRSFLSYTRHEYFRRILCNLIGSWVENGEYPADFDKLEEIVKNICYYNAKEYFI
ncbi:MAG: glucuronate isomerase [Oscillospiraceae bacterium]|jgi:glucuronate isomerase|nr:glucuronate isomerase [Oscillospiraceae bacterium]